MKKTGCFLIIIVVITVVAIAAWYDHEVRIFDANRQEVMQHCEVATPIFKKRYQIIGALLQLYEKHYGWEDGVFKGNPNTLQNDYEDANSDTVDSAKISPELQCSQPVQAGLARLNGGSSALDKCMGALDISDNMEIFIEVVNKLDDTNANVLMNQLKTDLAGTDHDAATAVEEINASIQKYNDALKCFPGSLVAKQFNIAPVNRASNGIYVPSFGSANN